MRSIRTIFIILILGGLAGCQNNNLPQPEKVGLFNPAPTVVKKTSPVKEMAAPIVTVKSLNTKPQAAAVTKERKEYALVKVGSNIEKLQSERRKLVDEIDEKNERIARLEKENRALKHSRDSLTIKMKKMSEATPVVMPKSEEDRKAYKQGQDYGKEIPEQLLTQAEGVKNLSQPYFLKGLAAGLDEALKSFEHTKNVKVESMKKEKKAPDMEPAAVKTNDSQVNNAAQNIATPAPAEIALQEGKALMDNIDHDKRYIILNNGVHFRIISKGKGKISPGQYVTSSIKESLANGKVTLDMEKTKTYYTQVIESYSPLFGSVIQEYLGVDGEAELVIPPEQAYGEKGHGPDIPPNSTMVYHIKVKSVK